MAQDGGEEIAAGRPLQLLYKDEHGHFQLGKEALNVLREVQSPVSVAAVCGRARQGKSFLLNALAGAAGGSGFRVESTQRPCTKGLWLWSAPIDRPDGSKMLLLDSEGIDAVDQTNQYSTQVFSLAVLLSSTFVYNQMGGIDEAALDRLSLVTEMTKHIHARSDSNGNTAEGMHNQRRELGKFSPFLLWLLRDFYLELNEDGRTISPSEYLERALSPVDTTTSAGQSKNEIRQSIKELFPQRACFTLIRPVYEERALRSLDQLPARELRSEFRDGVNALTNLIFERTEPKRVGGDVLNGVALASLAESYVSTINKGAVPSITSAWQAVAEGECRRAVDQAEEAYKESFDPEALPAEEHELDAAHSNCIAYAKKVFQQSAVGSQTIQSEHLAKLERTLNQQFSEMKRRKLAEAERATANALTDAKSKIESAAHEEGVSSSSVLREAERQLQSLAYAATGPKKIETVVELAKDALRQVAGVAEERKRAAEQQARSAQGEKLEAQKREAELKREKERQEANAHDAEERAQQSENLRFSEESAKKAKQAEIGELQRRLENEKKKVEYEQQAQESLKVQLDDYKTRLSNERKSLKDAQDKCRSLEQEHQSLQEQQSTVSNEKERYEGENKRLQSECEKLKSERDHLKSENERLVETLNKELRDYNEKLAQMASTPQTDSRKRQRIESADDDENAVETPDPNATRLEDGPAHANAEAAENSEDTRQDGAEPDREGGCGSAVEPEYMTVKQLKAVLTEMGYNDKVHNMAVSPPRGRQPKKDDWVNLYKNLTSKADGSS